MRGAIVQLVQAPQQVFFGVLVTVTKGKANFQLHAILAQRECCQPKRREGSKGAPKPRSPQNTKIAISISNSIHS